MNKIEIIIDRPEQDQLNSTLLIDDTVVMEMSSFYPKPIKIKDVERALELLKDTCFKYLNEEGVQDEPEQEPAGTA